MICLHTTVYNSVGILSSGPQSDVYSYVLIFNLHVDCYPFSIDIYPAYTYTSLSRARDPWSEYE